MGRMDVFTQLESEVRLYCQHLPVVFARTLKDLILERSGRSQADFFSGSGALNYGHNNPRLKKSLREYMEGDAVVHSLDMATVAKLGFLKRLEEASAAVEIGVGAIVGEGV